MCDCFELNWKVERYSCIWKRTSSVPLLVRLVLVTKVFHLNIIKYKAEVPLVA